MGGTTRKLHRGDWRRRHLGGAPAAAPAVRRGRALSADAAGAPGHERSDEGPFASIPRARPSGAAGRFNGIGVTSAAGRCVGRRRRRRSASRSWRRRASASTPSPSPVRAGVTQTCARLQDGTIWCWGDNLVRCSTSGDGAISAPPLQGPVSRCRWRAADEHRPRAGSAAVGHCRRYFLCEPDGGAAGDSSLGQRRRRRHERPWGRISVTRAQQRRGRVSVRGLSTSVRWTRLTTCIAGGNNGLFLAKLGRGRPGRGCRADPLPRSRRRHRHASLPAESHRHLRPSGGTTTLGNGAC